MTITDTPVDRPSIDNGVNTEALLGARTALSEAPEAAEFTWRATCEWVNGTHSRTTIDGFSGLGQDHQHRSTFAFDASRSSARKLDFRRSTFARPWRRSGREYSPLR